MLKRIAMVAIIGIVGFISMSPVAHAATLPQIINVTPSLTSLSANPGASTNGKIDIINIGTTAFKVAVSTSPYHVVGVDYNPQFTQLPGTVDPSQWVHFTTPTTDTLASQKMLTVSYTVDVPGGTAPGGYYAVIFAETGASESTQSGVVAHSRVGDILYITVNGPVKTAGTAIATTIPSVVIDIPVTLDVLVGNQGGLHFKTAVDTEIKDIFGTTNFSNTMPAYILPQTQRKMSTQWSPQAPIGIYHIERTVTLPNGPEKLPSQWVLVVKPWVIMLLIVIIILIVTIAILNIGRQGRKRRAQ
jgi:hypothetical protein